MQASFTEIYIMTITLNNDDLPIGFIDPLWPNDSHYTPHIKKMHNFDSEIEEGPMPTPEEHRSILQKWREEQATRKGKQKENEHVEKEAQIRVKRREADTLRL